MASERIVRRTDVTRRNLILTAAAAPVSSLGVAGSQTVDALPRPQASTMATLKSRLESGADAVLLVIGDSTAYSEFGPYDQFGAALGAEANCTVVLRRWGEWRVWQAAGPKTYLDPITLYSGQGPKLSIYLAALPGAVAGAMFDSTRRETAIKGIPRPDAIVWHHGHNHASFEQPIANWYGLGAGQFLGAVELASIAWPTVPQALVVQNPWRDNNNYDKIRGALLAAAQSHGSLGLIDGFTPFIDRARPLTLYRDNIHPSDREGDAAGAALTADTLMAAYRSAGVADIKPTLPWPALSAANLIDNGEFANWRGGAPSGWVSENALGLTRDTSVAFGGAPYSVAMTPDIIRPSALTRTLSAAELSRVKGKCVNLALLVHAQPSQPAPYGIFITRSGGQVRTFAIGGGLAGVRDGWSWLIASNVPIDADAGLASTVIKIFPAWGGKLPQSLAPVHVQKVLLTEHGPRAQAGT